VVKQRKQRFGPQWGPKHFKKSQHPLAVIVSDVLYKPATVHTKCPLICMIFADFLIDR
jgi:hypothetical protein